MCYIKEKNLIRKGKKKRQFPKIENKLKQIQLYIQLVA